MPTEEPPAPPKAPIIAVVFAGHDKPYAQKLYKSGATAVFLLSKDSKLMPVPDTEGKLPPRCPSIGKLPREGYAAAVGLPQSTHAMFGCHRTFGIGTATQWKRVPITEARDAVKAAIRARRADIKAQAREEREAAKRAAKEAAAKAAGQLREETPWYIPQALR